MLTARADVPLSRAVLHLEEHLPVQRLALPRQRLQERGLVVRVQRDGPALGAEHLEHVLEQHQQPLVQPARLGGLPGGRV